MIYKDPKDGSVHAPPSAGWLLALALGPIAFALWGAWRAAAAHIAGVVAIISVAGVASALGASDAAVGALAFGALALWHVFLAVTARGRVVASFARRGYLRLEHYE